MNSAGDTRRCESRRWTCWEGEDRRGITMSVLSGNWTGILVFCYSQQWAISLSSYLRRATLSERAAIQSISSQGPSQAVAVSALTWSKLASADKSSALGHCPLDMFSPLGLLHHWTAFQPRWPQRVWPEEQLQGRWIILLHVRSRGKSLKRAEWVHCKLGHLPFAFWF